MSTRRASTPLRALGLTLAAHALLPSCSDAQPDAHEEVAAELRALRLSLQAPASGVGSPRTATDVAAPFAPLQQVLGELARGQREQGERDAALARELQRWSQLFADGAGAARGDEWKAMSARLEQLELAAKAQDARHREVEALLQGALERTADRLDAFLSRLDGSAPADSSRSAPAPTRDAPPAAAPAAEPRTDAPVPNATAPPSATPSPNATSAPGAVPPRSTPPVRAGPPAAPAAPPPAAAESVPASETNAAAEPAPTPRNGAAAESKLAARVARPLGPWWWWALAVAASTIALLFVRRARRRGAPAATGTPPAALPAPFPAAADGREHSAQEIWAAAALLGEAVGRLRQRANGHDGADGPHDGDAPPVSVPRSTTSSALDPRRSLDHGSLDHGGLDAGACSPLGAPLGSSHEASPDGALPPEPHRVPPPLLAPPARRNGTPDPVARTAPAASAARLAPETLVAHVAGAAGEAKVLEALARERLVLRRPAPALRQLHGTLEIRFHVVPHATAAERGQLLQRLRDAAR
jgi:hypothetical protein